MKLQVAIDLCDTEGLLAMAKSVQDAVDIIEVGTPIIMLEGMKPVRKVREAFPDHLILSDTKIVDGGGLEARYACEAGADIITVLAVADDRTIQAAIEEAHRYGRKILVDLINVEDVVKRSEEIDQMHADYICVHTASDVQATGKNPIEELRRIASVVKEARLAAAGGINGDTVHDIMDAGADIIIIGSSITNAQDPKQMAQTYKNCMEGHT